jgi:hypothetical protein
MVDPEPRNIETPLEAEFVLRLDRHTDMMRIRRAAVEPPFSSLKAWMGSTHLNKNQTIAR